MFHVQIVIFVSSITSIHLKSVGAQKTTFWCIFFALHVVAIPKYLQHITAYTEPVTIHSI